MTLHELSNEINKIKGQVFDNKVGAKAAIRRIIRECGYSCEWRSDDRSCYTWASIGYEHDKRIQGDKLVLTVEFRCRKVGRKWEVKELNFNYHFDMNWGIEQIVEQILADQDVRTKELEERNQKTFEKIRTELNLPVESIRDLAVLLKRLDSMMGYEFRKAINKEQTSI